MDAKEICKKKGLDCPDRISQQVIEYFKTKAFYGGLGVRERRKRVCTGFC